MEKEVVLKWLHNCSEDGSVELCVECPFSGSEDCDGDLMQAAAELIENQEG